MIDWLQRRLASLPVGAAVRRVAPHLAFVRARLCRHSDDGLRLTLAVLLFVGAIWLFAGVAEDVVTGDPLVDVDHAITRWLHEHATAGVTRWMRRLSDAHGAVPISALGLAFALYLAWRRKGRWLLTLALVLPGGMLMNLLLKQIFRRGRPLFDEPLLSLASYSFPSGHVTGATLFYGLLAAFLAAQTPRLGRRLGLFAGAFFVVVLVGTSRIYLGAHYFSDVVAAAAWGTAWIVLCGVAVDAWRRAA